MLFLKPGERSGKHRHMWEELVFVVEGEGYDLHWDMKFDCQDNFHLGMGGGAQEIRVEAAATYVYVPPYTNHQQLRRPSEARAHRDEQPHHQGHGLRLDRPVGAGAGLLSVLP